MAHDSCPGYGTAPWAALVADYPGEETYPVDSFRTEWGPVFHRGRLDGSARILLIGQDPAQHEVVARRTLVGEAGQRIQGFVRRLGIERSYLFCNTFLYSVYGQGGGTRHIGDAGIRDYRNRWFDAVAQANDLQAVVALGTLADTAYHAWPGSHDAGWAYAAIKHPTYPDSASASGTITRAEAMKKLCTSWNAGLDVVHPALTADHDVPLMHYGDALETTDLAEIPEADLPAGSPDWMRSLDSWARRTGATASEKRYTITVSVPAAARPPQP